jgi:hypothetical protein
MTDSNPRPTGQGGAEGTGQTDDQTGQGGLESGAMVRFTETGMGMLVAVLVIGFVG